MPKSKPLLDDDLLDHFTDSVNFGSDEVLRARQRELYVRMRKEKKHTWDDPKSLLLAVER